MHLLAIGKSTSNHPAKDSFSCTGPPSFWLCTSWSRRWTHKYAPLTDLGNISLSLAAPLKLPVGRCNHFNIWLAVSRLHTPHSCRRFLSSKLAPEDLEIQQKLILNFSSDFLQEINHAGVGGLDPELVSNRGGHLPSTSGPQSSSWTWELSSASA